MPCDLQLPSPPRRAPVARGIELRYLLILILNDRQRPATVAELAASIERRGFFVPGRPGKVISDALRWEESKGRIRRVDHNRYVAAYVSRQTLWRMRQRMDAVLAEPDVWHGKAA